jgi:hypothetical protein
LGLFLASSLVKLALSAGLATLLALLVVFRERATGPSRTAQMVESWTIVVTLAVLWPAWTALWRGGLGLRILGMAMVRADGAPPSRWRLLWREACFWIPIAAVAGLSDLLEGHGIGKAWLKSVTVGAMCLIPVVYGAHALFFPGRFLHDRLAGTALVPE